MFGIDAVDLIIILVLGVVMFGPEKLPELSRKAARVFVYIRDIANNAQNTLRSELGPEYADLELRDLNPKAFIAKHLREEMALIEETKRELQEAKQALVNVSQEVKQEADGITGTDTPVEEYAALSAPGLTSPFDPEAT